MPAQLLDRLRGIEVTMIRKHRNYNRPYEGDAPHATRQIETNGHFLARGVFTSEEIDRLRAEIDEVYATHLPDWRPGSKTREHAEMFRYQMFNRSPLCQKYIARREILEILEPLLGDDCHVIACTAWRNTPGRASAPEGQQWHVDGGPYIARPEGQEWPRGMAYPIFVVTTHIWLQDVSIDDGPTAVLPGSHMSGRLPPHEGMWDLDLEYQGRRAEIHLANAGDVTFFVSESWHRRMPTTDACRGRYFLQTPYARREIAQRILPTDEHNAVSPAALSRAHNERERQLLGIHPASFYDG